MDAKFVLFEVEGCSTDNLYPKLIERGVPVIDELTQCIHEVKNGAIF